jgi:hypothetical protein
MVGQCRTVQCSTMRKKEEAYDVLIRNMMQYE